VRSKCNPLHSFFGIWIFGGSFLLLPSSSFFCSSARCSSEHCCWLSNQVQYCCRKFSCIIRSSDISRQQREASDRLTANHGTANEPPPGGPYGDAHWRQQTQRNDKLAAGASDQFPPRQKFCDRCWRCDRNRPGNDQLVCGRNGTCLVMLLKMLVIILDFLSCLTMDACLRTGWSVGWSYPCLLTTFVCVLTNRTCFFCRVTTSTTSAITGRPKCACD